MSDEWLDERLANRRKPGDPDYDAFYDGTDAELAGMVPPPVERAIQSKSSTEGDRDAEVH